MSLSKEFIQSASPEEIYKLILPKLNRNLGNFKFLNFSKDEYHDLIIREIIDSKKQYSGKKPYSKYLNGKIQLRLINIVKECLRDEEKTFDVFCSYLNQILEGHSDDSTLVHQNLKKVDSFCKNFDFIPSEEIMENLLRNNQHLNKIIEATVERYKESIKSGDLYNISDIMFIIMAIESYCRLNNIEIGNINDGNHFAYDQNNIGFDDSTKRYLREIGAYPLLTSMQERLLAEEVKSGNIGSRTKFIHSNLRLVANIAKLYIGKGMDYLDMIQEGNIGLMKAVDDFDPDLGHKFSTYATFKIRAYIERAIKNKSRNVRIPVHKLGEISAYKRAVLKLENQNQGAPTIEEIAREMDLPVSKVIEIHNLQYDTVSLNQLVGDDDDIEVGDLVPAPGESVENQAIELKASSELFDLLRLCLDERQVQVVAYRLGLVGDRKLTLEEIGQIMDITRERVRQIESQSYSRLRIVLKGDGTLTLKEGYRKVLSKKRVVPEQIPESYNRGRKIDASKKEKDYMSGRRGRQKLSIYKLVGDFPREIVDAVIGNLSDYDREVFDTHYATNSVEQDQAHKNYFSSKLVPKIRQDVIKMLRESDNSGVVLEDVKKLSAGSGSDLGEQNELSAGGGSDLGEQNELSAGGGSDLEKPEELPAGGSSDLEKPEELPAGGGSDLEKPEELSADGGDSDLGQRESSDFDETSRNANGLLELDEEPGIFVGFIDLNSADNSSIDLMGLSDDDCRRLFSLWKLGSFPQLAQDLGDKEAIIFALRTGFVDGKCFSTESLSEFFDIDPQDVRDIATKGLECYKENIDKLFDAAIRWVSSSDPDQRGNQYSKVPKKRS